jgi:hypothetical protein
MSIKKCPRCQKDFDDYSQWGAKKFCSKSCASSRGPRSEDFKVKVRKKLIGVASPHKGKEIVERIFKNCYICDVPVKIKINKIDNNVTCKSKNCLSEHSRISGKISASVRTKRSKDEIELFDLCKNYFINVSSNKILFDGWDADITLDEFKIAILWNGPWHYKQLSFNNHSLSQVQTRDKIKKRLFEQNGWKVFIFEDRNYTPKSAFEELVGAVGFEPTK